MTKITANICLWWIKPLSDIQPHLSARANTEVMLESLRRGGLVGGLSYRVARLLKLQPLGRCWDGKGPSHLGSYLGREGTLDQNDQGWPLSQEVMGEKQVAVWSDSLVGTQPYLRAMRGVRNKEVKRKNPV